MLMQDLITYVEVMIGSPLARLRVVLLPPNCGDNEVAHTDKQLRLSWCHSSFKKRLLYRLISFIGWTKGLVKTEDQTSSNLR